MVTSGSTLGGEWERGEVSAGLHYDSVSIYRYTDYTYCLVRFIMRLGLLVDYFFIWQNVVISNVTSYDHKLEDVRTGQSVGAASTRLGYLGLPDTERL